VYRRQELTRLAEICLRKGLTICSDEIHCDLVYPPAIHTPIAALDPEIAQHTITLMAPSKTFNIAGLECSFAIIPNPELRRQFVQARRGIVPEVNVLGYVAALAAYRAGQEWLDQLLVYLAQNRDLLATEIEQHLPGICMAKPEGTYLAWLDCRALRLPVTAYDFFLENAGVALNAGESYGPGGDGFVRLNFGCQRSILLEALERMQQALILSNKF
jgi:cysteine-S-conjugate beta-lyase